MVTFLEISLVTMNAGIDSFQKSINHNKSGLPILRNLSKMKLGVQLFQLQNNLKNWGIYNLNSVIITRVSRILESQNRFQSLYDEIFNNH